MNLRVEEASREASVGTPKSKLKVFAQDWHRPLEKPEFRVQSLRLGF